jgi:hypothetical protein
VETAARDEDKAMIRCRKCGWFKVMHFVVVSKPGLNIEQPTIGQILIFGRGPRILEAGCFQEVES